MSSLLKLGRNAWCEEAVEQAGLLIDGDDYYRAFYEAGQQATRFILLAGWQFDTDACLLRGVDAEQATLPVSLLEYLDALCERNPQLRVCILAWDFHAVFALEREWMQDLRFKWLTKQRVEFLFDAHHPEGGSHHQKFVVIDGRLAFLGGLDLCDHRWDDRHHRIPNPLRVSRGAPHQPFHDVQAYVVGNAFASRLVELFSARWRAAGGAALDLPVVSETTAGSKLRGGVPLATSRAALSRVDPNGAPDASAGCREVFQLTLDAIGAAQRVIYVETQYFSSEQIARALCDRLRESRGVPLDVVLVLNAHAETFKEEVAVGLAQARVIMQLRQAATSSSNRLGIYYTIPETEVEDGPVRATYIHSKLLIVDDRLLSVGSANWTNRSTHIDTELNVTFEAQSDDDPLRTSISAARRSLLAEHLGLSQVDEADGLVDALDERARACSGRLRLHPSPTEKERLALDVIDPRQLPFDPAAPEAQQPNASLFAHGIGALLERLTGRGG